MKKYLVTLFLAFCFTISFAQSQVDNEKIRRFYCEVKGVEKDLSAGLKIIFDFGDRASFNVWGGLTSKLKFVDDNGKEIEFNSMVDAANYMVERGWVFQQAYSSVYFSKKPVLHWIFYKDANSFEEAREGILTKEEYKKQKK